jgi:hypothetical protein
VQHLKTSRRESGRKVRAGEIANGAARRSTEQGEVMNNKAKGAKGERRAIRILEARCMPAATACSDQSRYAIARSAA